MVVLCFVLVIALPVMGVMYMDMNMKLHIKNNRADAYDYAEAEGTYSDNEDGHAYDEADYYET